MLPNIGDTTAAMVWGIPVKPVDLLNNLDAYRKAIPIIHTLRLCNQFGKGDSVFVTRLPKELIGLIEEELLVLQGRHKKRSDHGWIKKYCCFEGSCRPSDHMADVGYPFEAGAFESMIDDALIRLSETHAEWPMDEWLSNGYSSLPAHVQKLVDAEVAHDFDDYVDDYGDELIWELRDENSLNWPSKVRKHMSSKENKDVLRKHFGLDVWIMHENLDTTTTEYLKRTKRFSHTMFDPQQATICYLILPTRAAQWGARVDPDCGFSGDLFGFSANSMLVDSDSLSLTEERQRRFARVMLRLALKPSVHPSQLRAALSAAPAISSSSSPLRQVPFPTTDGNLSVKEKAKRDAATKKRIKDLEASHWPKLMLLVDQNYSDV
ncbi:hypothetical protein KCU65_g9716, partial [Aureobasidium melanogenum]